MTTGIGCTPAAKPALTVTQTVSPVSGIDSASGNISYTITVHNRTSSPVDHVGIADTLPEGVVLMSLLPCPNGVCKVHPTENQITCALDTLGAGESKSVNLVVHPLTTGAKINRIVVNDQNGDNLNLAASSTVSEVSIADLQVGLRASSDSVHVNDTVTYTATVHNIGDDDAVGVVLADVLPQGMVFTSPVTDSRCTASSRVLTCNIGTLRNNATTTITFSERSTLAGFFHNLAIVSTSNADPNPSNNAASIPTTVGTTRLKSADLSLTVENSFDPITFNHQLTYAITIHNAGPSDAGRVTVTELLSPGVTFNHSVPDGACVSSTNVVKCSVGQLTNGSSSSLKITVNPSQTGFLYSGFAVYNDNVPSNLDDGNAANDATGARTVITNPLFCAIATPN